MIGGLPQTLKDSRRRKKANNGFTLIELLIVVTIVVILTAISLPYIYNYKRLYKSEDQALKLMDLMREANQLALNRRHNFRVEIDLTDNALLLIDEASGAAGKQVKSLPLESPADIRIDVNPTGITPPNPPNYANATFATDTVGHTAQTSSTTITGHNIWVARFRSDGSVVNSAGAPVSATIYSWPPKTSGGTTARNTNEVRAVTLYGGSGAVRYWKYNGTAFQAY